MHVRELWERSKIRPRQIIWRQKDIRKNLLFLHLFKPENLFRPPFHEFAIIRELEQFASKYYVPK